MTRKIAAKARRKSQARRLAGQGTWTGLGLMGVIGWTVALPTVAGALIGVWIDSRYPGQYSWTLMLLASGLVFGCLGAWRWLRQEGHDGHPENDEKENHND
jgi:ATP synthase protein I